MIVSLVAVVYPAGVPTETAVVLKLPVRPLKVAGPEPVPGVMTAGVVIVPTDGTELVMTTLTLPFPGARSWLDP